MWRIQSPPVRLRKGPGFRAIEEYRQHTSNTCHIRVWVEVLRLVWFQTWFIRLATVGSKIGEVARNSEKIPNYSSKVIKLGASWKRICNLLLVVSCNFAHILYHFWDLMHNAKNSLFSSPHPCMTPLLRGNALEFLDETHLTKLVGYFRCSSGRADLWPWGRGFQSQPQLLCTNSNSTCHPFGVG